MAKTVIGLFDDYTQAREVVRDLVDSGFMRDDISLVAHDAAKERARELDTTHEAGDAGTGALKGAGVGAGIGGVAGLAAGLASLAIPGIGPIIAAGPLASALAGAGVGAVAGGLIGALTNIGVPEEEAHYYAEGVRRGGTLVTVKTSDDMANRAEEIISRHHPVDVDERASTWRENKWERFDEKAQPLTADEITRERESYGSRTRTSHAGEGRDVGTSGVRRSGTRIHSLVEDSPAREQVGPRMHTVGLGGTGTTTGGRGASRDLDPFEEDYRRHHQTAYAGRNVDYDSYRPAYRFGHDLGTNERYRTGEWTTVEPEARREWESRYRDRGKWEDFKEAVRHAWDKARH